MTDALAAALKRIEQHADQIYVRDVKDGVVGTYRLTELTAEQLLVHVCRWIREHEPEDKPGQANDDI
jgi:DNA-binding HxlR family transcriptional regulator